MKNVNKEQSVRQGRFIQFIARDGLRLSGFLSGSNGKKIVIHVHGLGGNFYRSALSWLLADNYAKAGYDFFSVNTRGHDWVANGTKKKGRQWNRTRVGTTYERFESCADDINGAVDCATGLGYKEIILQGHSTGCQKITYYQGKINDRRIKALVLLAPADDLNIAKNRLKSRYGKAIAFVKKMIKERHGNEFLPYWIHRSPITAKRYASFAMKGNTEADLFDYETGNFRLLKRIKQPILAIFGDKEEHKTKDIKECLLLLKENAISSKKTDIAIVEGANHGFEDRERALSSFVVHWLNELHKK